jgi:Uma2 family endonuclease
MTELVEFENDRENGALERGSFSHSLAQSQLTILVSEGRKFRVMVELSLDATQIDLSQFGLKSQNELIPDLSIYQRGGHRPKKGRDIMKISEMPLLVIEILSPKQGLDDILAKFEAYFALGVKSCWLVIPLNESITVYSTSEHFKTFGNNSTEVIDEVIGIQLPIKEIFDPEDF